MYPRLVQFLLSVMQDLLRTMQIIDTEPGFRNFPNHRMQVAASVAIIFFPVRVKSTVWTFGPGALPVRLTTHFSWVLVQPSAIRCKNLVAIGGIGVNCSKLGSQIGNPR